MGIIEDVQAMLPEDDIRFAFGGQTGIKPSWRWLSFWLNVFNKTRVIAITQQRIAVFSGHQARWARSKPKALLYQLPRDTVIGPLDRGWSKIQLGQEKIWVAKNTHPYIEKANAEIASGTAFVAVAPVTEQPPITG
jgi:hypothetical protein